MPRRAQVFLLGGLAVAALLVMLLYAPLSLVHHREVMSKAPVESRPWLDDPECRDFTIRLGRSLPKMALASYPGSGNTWIRAVIERLTGYFTGSIYDDEQLYKNGKSAMEDPAQQERERGIINLLRPSNDFQDSTER